YANAKQGLFRMPGLAAAAINLDDECGRRFFSELPAGVAAIGFGIEHADAAVRGSRIETRAAGLGFDLHSPWGEARIESRLLGRFNVSNLLAVVASLGLLGYDFNAICAALAELDPVPGRMNRLGGSEGCALVVIDYAHTPDALQQALASAREHCANQLLCVFGCGGERDVGKRPLMAEIAERLADRVIVTDDNPRSEDGARIVADILAGFDRAEAVVVERDRRRAIERAVGGAGPGDVVLIAGKGHEPYQEVNGVMHAFDDFEVARTAIEARPC
ncbi:MAG: UDP-N-acetylmuramoyl-L-alanyl-D-glutamate--2,6-diaminopimelate ligase, partial [Rhodanobacteraceae bacterium]|nr:UDP-N-acetylmuramoyl-L-alanyl-D-glutamate--2,6-diaminopimelate ligase [Rhodanobacteraceae bacterium]